jgi:GNAT superfamily N-acetyltransferase
LEIGFVATPQAETATEVQLHRVVKPSDWSRKLQVHRETDIGADGYTYPAELWTELIRRKWLTGHKVCFLIEFRGHIVGTIGAIDAGPLLRLKNLFVLPEFRRRGMATGALQRLSQLAYQANRAAIGVFAISGTPGHALYQSRGFRATTGQVEWTRKLA